MSTPLRTQFNKDMTLRNFSPKTKEAYIGAVYGLAKYYGKSPHLLNNDQIQDYLFYLIEKKKLAWSSVNVSFSGLRCFFINTLGWDETRFSIPPRKKQRKLPMLLSVEEVMRILGSTGNLKHRTVLETVYGAGLRVSEAVRLQPHHIESNTMSIRVEQGKGQKGRYTILPQTLLERLKEYWREYKPGEWLFFGRDRNAPMSVGTAQRIFYNAKRKAGVQKGRGIHTLRHGFASHLLARGIDVYTLKRIMGHSSLKTTFGYCHVSREQLLSVVSPLDIIEGGCHEKTK